MFRFQPANTVYFHVGLIEKF